MKIKIKNDKELAKAIEKANELIQAVEDYQTSKVPSPVARLSFPYGFIRSANHHRNRLQFVRNAALQSNMAYTLILTDSLSWLLNRTNISGTAAEMLRKLQMFIAGALVESITKDYLKGICGKGYKDRTKYLVANNIIEQSLKEDLDWLWDVRNKMHLFLVDDSEYINEYTSENHARASIAFQQLIAALSKKKIMC